MKLHLCCGDVYLDGYVNIDTVGDFSRTNSNLTTFDNYYKNNFVKDAHQRKIIVDRRADLLKKWVIKNGEVDEIVMVCALEHFTLDQAKFIISEAHRVLKPGGKFKFDFPDIEETIKQYHNDPEFMMRLIYGTHKNEYSVHKFGYTRSLIYKLLGNQWSEIKFGDIVKHDYPMQGVTATK